MENIMTIGTETRISALKEERPELVAALATSYTDSFAYTSTNVAEYIDAAKMFGEGRISFDQKVSEVQFDSMPPTGFDAYAFTKEDDDLRRALVLDSMESGTKVFATIDGEQFMLRDTANITIYQRLGISGPALDSLPGETLAAHLNDYAKYAKGEGKVIFNNGKIEAMLGPNYKLIPFEEVMEKAAEYFGALGASFEAGYFSHTASAARWKTGTCKIDIPINTGINNVEFEQTVTISTSDCGIKAVTVSPNMKASDALHGLQYCLPLHMDHTGEASIENFERLLGLINRRFKKATDNITELANTSLMYPTNVLLALMKWLKIPAKYGAEVYERRKSMWVDSEHSAYEVYATLTDVLATILGTDKTMRSLAEYQERFARGLDFKFEDYDLPGNYSYNDRLIGKKGV